MFSSKCFIIILQVYHVTERTLRFLQINKEYGELSLSLSFELTHAHKHTHIHTHTHTLKYTHAQASNSLRKGGEVFIILFHGLFER